MRSSCELSPTSLHNNDVVSSVGILYKSVNILSLWNLLISTGRRNYDDIYLKSQGTEMLAHCHISIAAGGSWLKK